MRDDTIIDLNMERSRAGRLDAMRRVEEQMKLREKYSFSVDWFSRHLPVWNQLVLPYRAAGVRVLEVGCFEGAATTWLLDHVLVDDQSRMDVCDTFQGNADRAASETTYDEMEGVKDVFQRNIKLTGNDHKVQVHQQMSSDFLCSLPRQPTYDVAYIDGSHVAKHVLEDAVGVWPLLRDNGLLIFDDYCWDLLPNEWERPKVAIDAFLACYHPELQVLHRDLQVLVKKCRLP
mmetsp:Transcript_25672/g.48673  ORF Transcript_25672/g.48673 Transcript_25672/m.48673 type:complete len:232 (+) Transcript_25672:128-823(+)|eukprot:CAMPEP_0114252360 /NCGR_PEP_ID=MMETSP0058-20121206/15790_1 /TAXON_ID=36894 /ORGANISM="Pyramimonas parkeae, CCMP726" /LENGTH=231 /DNA_ID=CAMNT_0001366279 /DNA_START=106 /DNA_END=801 /DNA_ORIENTATION=+